MRSLIYLDNSATTSLDPEVFEAMQQYAHLPLNPSSVHTYGSLAKKLLKNARIEIASCLNIAPQHLVFTSGGTESLNMLIRGLYPGKGAILTTSIEHSAVDNTLAFLEKQGALIKRVPVGAFGAPTIENIIAHLSDDVSLMVFSAVYSETGVKLDLAAVGAVANRHSIPLIIDGVALLGKEPFEISPGITGMAFSSHKLHGPTGVGAAYINTTLSPLLYGAPQEQGLRPGTEPMLAILGFAKAVSLAYSLMPQTIDTMRLLRDTFELRLKKELNISINGEGPRVANISNIAFHDLDAETLLLSLDREGVCASMGSACSAGAIEPSRVLLNMGYARERAKSSLRFSLSRKTTAEEMDKTLNSLVQIASRQPSFH